MSRISKHAGCYFGLCKEPGPMQDHNLIAWIKIKRAIVANDGRPQLFEVLCDVASAGNDGSEFVRYCIRRGWLEEK
jgi:hypothetical protein